MYYRTKAEIWFGLHQKTVYFADGRVENEQAMKWSQSECYATVLPGDSESFSKVPFQIPFGIPVSMKNNDVIDVSYTIRMKVVLGGIFDFSVNIPIIIGTLPVILSP